MKKPVLLAIGVLSVAAGVMGAFLPLLPTVPFLLLAAWCFARANPAWEQKLLDHPRYGPQLRAWRARGVISRPAKLAAALSLLFSAALGLLLLPGAWRWVPAGVAVIVGSWILTRPST